MFRGPFGRDFTYFCLSTDTKPTLKVEGGSVLYETDTGDKYIFSGSNWLQVISDMSLSSVPLPTGASTEDKQDSIITVIDNLLTELQLKANLTEAQPTSDVNYEIVFRRLLEAVQHPEYYNGVSNALQALLITGSTTAVTGTLTGVTTVTGLTNIGGVGADMVVRDISADTWGINIRSLLS